MRPVHRGDAPLDADGNAVEFGEYKEARDPLIARIGDFCSYCEIVLHSTIHVEHVRPKSRRPDLALQWSDFLLACDSCNSTKGDEDVVLADYFWPDTDNTARPFVYETDAPPKMAGGLSAADAATAVRTVELTGLDRVPGHPRFSDRDRRWFKRREVWGIALLALRRLEANDTGENRLWIGQLAISRGFWSVWMAVFRDHVEMRQILLSWFAGTARDCFDANTNLVPRYGGKA
jgi:uncharacterized protein (TIGR02646 family)